MFNFGKNLIDRGYDTEIVACLTSGIRKIPYMIICWRRLLDLSESNGNDLVIGTKFLHGLYITKLWVFSSEVYDLYDTSNGLKKH